MAKVYRVYFELSSGFIDYLESVSYEDARFVQASLFSDPDVNKVSDIAAVQCDSEDD